MVKNLITVQRAKEKVKELQSFIKLVENYEANTLEKWIIKEYGYTNSFLEVVRRAEAKGLQTDNGEPVTRDLVASIISSKPKDELHRILRLGYRHRIKPNKTPTISYYR